MTVYNNVKFISSVEKIQLIDLRFPILRGCVFDDKI